jgi:hypothetical protein
MIVSRGFSGRKQGNDYLIFGTWKTCWLLVNFGIWERDAFLLPPDRWERVRHLEFDVTQKDMYVLEDDGGVEGGIHTS